jgi:hypothetical protein
MRARVAATDAFARRAGLCAYLVAALSIAYVVVNPGFKDYQRKTTRVIQPSSSSGFPARRASASADR